jgi:hypothetical protein
MTTSDTLKPQLPLERDPYTWRINWRAWRRIAVVLLVIAAIAGPLTGVGAHERPAGRRPVGAK